MHGGSILHCMNLSMPFPDHLGKSDAASFVAHIGPLVEHSPWVAERAWRRGPFADFEAVHAALCAEIGAASTDEQLALVRAHPELAGSEARAGTMTRESTSEQSRLGLNALDAAHYARLTTLNARYREKFGFPLLIALRLHPTVESVLAAGEARLANDAATELRTALGQIHEIVRGRLAALASRS